MTTTLRTALRRAIALLLFPVTLPFLVGHGAWGDCPPGTPGTGKASQSYFAVCLQQPFCLSITDTCADGSAATYYRETSGTLYASDCLNNIQFGTCCRWADYVCPPTQYFKTSSCSTICREASKITCNVAANCPP
jgi:hypothetical protein